MRPTEFVSRNRLRPNRIKNKSRYITNAIYSHSKPVAVPMSKEPVDDPATRGLTREDDKQCCPTT
jgi:hypothetical protein